MADHQVVADDPALGPALATWHRLWLQAHGQPTPSDDRVRHELAAFRARLDAFGHLVAGSAASSGASADLPGPAELMARVVAGAGGPAGGAIVPALVATGRPELRVERSRPGWCLSGVALVLAPRGQIVPADACLAAFAIDEGDNEVLVDVTADAPGVRVEPATTAAGAGRQVIFTGVELADDDVVTGIHQYAVLRDQVAVHILRRALDAASSLAPTGRWDDELALARASVHAAAEAAGLPQLTKRSTAVSSAVTHVLPLCESIAATTGGTSSRASEVREAATYLNVRWHLTRLAALL